MSYSVKQLAQMSGVSVRTLHWYDKKGLLTPSFVGENGYRYYHEDRLLRLQQNSFFTKSLVFGLDQILSLLDREDFDNVKALSQHRWTLLEEISRKKRLIATIEKTISHLQGEQKMEEKGLYKGFDKNKTYIFEGSGSAQVKILE